MKTHVVLAAILAVAISAVSKSTLATQIEAGGSLIGDFNAGADKLATLEFTDSSTQEIKGGNGVIFAGGVGALFFNKGSHRLETLLTIGLKYSTMQPTTNADLSFVRVPVELLGFYRNEALHFRVGGGAASYFGSSLSGSGAASGLHVAFKPALGGIVEADFVSGGFSLGLRYTRLTLTPSGSNISVAANSLGVGLSYFYHFGAK